MVKSSSCNKLNGSGTFQGQPSDLKTEARLFYDEKIFMLGLKLLLIEMI